VTAEARGVVVLPDAAAAARAAAERFRRAAVGARDERGRFVVVLSGGSTPRTLYSLLATCRDLPWPATHVLFADERCVSPEDERSNYRMVRESLLSKVPVPDRHVHRMRGELEPETAALGYEGELRALFPGCEWPACDLALLGVGADGHTASLFPGTRALAERERWVAAHEVPQLASWRLTLTLPVLRAARQILFLVTGQEKARVVAEAFGGLPHGERYPCELVGPTRGVRAVLLDRAAGSMLR
jgi:6-phosphogluconolactonase